MPTNFELTVIVLLLVNIGVSIYVAANKKSEYYQTPTPTTKPPLMPPRIR